MNIKNNYLIIMAGGVGTRFWPFSRTKNPKQFHDVLGTGRTLLQQTADRFQNICPPENIYVVTSDEYDELCKEQLPFLSKNQLLLEPIRRNTAPCIAYACYKIASQNPQANIVVAPSDHIILKEEVFREKVTIALDYAEKNDVLITLGINPTRPDTGYGYIQFEPDFSEVKKVRLFAEKPDSATAKAFIESGEFVWNAGIFVWNVQSILKAFKRFLPDVDDAFSDFKAHFYTKNEQNFLKNPYALCNSISIDKGIMEKAENVFVVLSDVGWSDLGTWKSLYEVSDKDEGQNVIDGHVLTFDTEECIIKTPKERLVVVNGLKGFIVAEYENVLMICRKDDEQKVKEFVALAKEQGNVFV